MTTGSSVGEKRGRWMRHCACALIVFTTLTVIYTLRDPAPTRIESAASNLISESGKLVYIVDTPTCQIPDFDAFSPEARDAYIKTEPKSCPGKPSFLRLRNWTVPEVDQEILERYHPGVQKVVCHYREIKRNESNDNGVVLGALRTLKLGQPHHVEFNLVYCTDAKRPTRSIMQTFLVVPVLKDKVEARCEKQKDKLPDDYLNVMIFVLDSVSRLNSVRHLVETRKYLENDPTVFEMLGYNKLGDNSFPNQGVLLTGLPEGQIMQYAKDKQFDNVPFQWNEFAERGYRTLFQEESPQYGLFNYLLKGFVSQPTDYYLRPLTIQVVHDPHTHWHSIGRLCALGGLHASEIYLDYIQRWAAFLVSQNKPFYAYSCISDVSHDDMNKVAQADSWYLRLFRQLNDSNTFNRTLVVFLSDHGVRYGKLRSTLQGKFEDRLPFAFLKFPNWYLDQHPEFVRALRINKHRLSTHFDIHATIEHVLKNRDAAPTSYGRSLLRVIPLNRTCYEAGVSAHWCTCQTPGKQMQELSLTSPLAVRMAREILDNLNGRLDLSLCNELSLGRVIDFRQIHYGIAESELSYYLVTVSASPGEASLEATVSLNRTIDEMHIVDKIGRLNWYREQAWCMKDHHLEAYCICRNKKQ